MQTPADQTYDRVWADVRALLAGRNAPQVREIHRYPAALAVVLDAAPAPATLRVKVTHASPYDDLYAMLLAKLDDELEMRWPRATASPHEDGSRAHGYTAPAEAAPIATWGERLAVAPLVPWGEVKGGALAHVVGCGIVIIWPATATADGNGEVRWGRHGARWTKHDAAGAAARVVATGLTREQCDALAQAEDADLAVLLHRYDAPPALPGDPAYELRDWLEQFGEIDAGDPALMVAALEKLREQDAHLVDTGNRIYEMQFDLGWWERETARAMRGDPALDVNLTLVSQGALTATLEWIRTWGDAARATLADAGQVDVPHAELVPRLVALAKHGGAQGKLVRSAWSGLRALEARGVDMPKKPTRTYTQAERTRMIQDAVQLLKPTARPGSPVAVIEDCPRCGADKESGKPCEFCAHVCKVIDATKPRMTRAAIRANLDKGAAAVLELDKEIAALHQRLTPRRDPQPAPAAPMPAAGPKPGDVVAWNDAPSGALVRDHAGEIALRIGERGDWVYLRVPFACGAKWVWYSWRDDNAWHWCSENMGEVTIVALDVQQSATPAEMQALAEKT